MSALKKERQQIKQANEFRREAMERRDRSLQSDQQPCQTKQVSPKPTGRHAAFNLLQQGS